MMRREGQGKMKNLVFTLICAFSLSACSSLPRYHPVSKPGASGFSDQKIDATHYRVSFQGDASTPRYQVEDYLLLRAAELTDEMGFEYFIITEKETDSKTTITTRRRSALYGRFDHYHGHPIYSFPYYAYGYVWGHPLDTETREYTRYSAIAYIEMHEGSKPLSNSRAFDASDVMKNLGPIECWKEEPHDESECKLKHLS